MTERPILLSAFTLVERLDPDSIDVLGGSADDKERFLRSDQMIRSGLCPNGHGLMTAPDGMQECSVCGFSTNVLPALAGQ